MRIIRLKLFSRNHINLTPFEIPEEWDGLYDTVETEVYVDTNLWQSEINNLVSYINKDKARKIKKSIENNPYNLYNDDPDIENERTHSLEQFSKKDIQVWSKDISTVDRFLYDVHRPRLIKEERRVVIDVRIQNLSDHKYKGKHYSEVVFINKLRVRL